MEEPHYIERNIPDIMEQTLHDSTHVNYRRAHGDKLEISRVKEK